jgi:hypothetical protein
MCREGGEGKPEVASVGIYTNRRFPFAALPRSGQMNVGRCFNACIKHLNTAYRRVSDA